MSVFQQMQQDVVGGYIKEQCVDKRDDSYPFDLNKIIAEFLGNIFIKFDVVSDVKLERFVHEDGKLMKTEKGLEGEGNFGCSFGIKKGITIIDVECVKPGSINNVMGILSNIEEFKENKWTSNITGYKYWWRNGYGIYGEKDQQDIVQHVSVWDSWKPNDILTFKIDMNKWKITFYLNTVEHCIMPLKRDIEYYFTITQHSVSSSGQDEVSYRLL